MRTKKRFETQKKIQKIRLFKHSKTFVILLSINVIET